jgi:hypothetical protein
MEALKHILLIYYIKQKFITNQVKKIKKVFELKKNKYLCSMKKTISILTNGI